MTTLTALAVEILSTADPDGKVAKITAAAKAWRHGDLVVGQTLPPERPARLARPVLMGPREMPKRSTGPKGRIALVHAIAHIELNAVDLAWDVVARFGAGMPRAFFDDWVDVALEETEHYAALAARLRSFDVAYGDLPAHDGLWEAAMRSAADLAARLALIPMTFEARGLDTTPPTTEKRRASGDAETAAILDVIYTDEIKHLAVGVRWCLSSCAGPPVRTRTPPTSILSTRDFRAASECPSIWKRAPQAAWARTTCAPGCKLKC